jgi:hypothetical protein
MFLFFLESARQQAALLEVLPDLSVDGVLRRQPLLSSNPI